MQLEIKINALFVYAQHFFFHPAFSIRECRTHPQPHSRTGHNNTHTDTLTN